MNIKANGKDVQVSENITLAQFLVDKKIKSDTVVIEYNKKIIKDYFIELKENDCLEIIQMVGGG